MDRREKLLNQIDLPNSRGIEIGALASPLVTKADSDVRYVDWTDQRTLQAKYAADPNVDTSKIVSVDAVWGQQTLAECLGPTEKFDYALASHVIEHVPDLIGWLNEIAEVLRPGGLLSLAIPDCRFTFDYLRQTTRTADVIDAWLRRDRCPSPRCLFDYVANVVEVNLVEAWQKPLDPTGLRHYSNRHAALAMAREALNGTYHDAHCWVVTPRSLLGLLQDLLELDLLPFACAGFYDTEPLSNEFVLILRRRSGDTPEEIAEAQQSFLGPLAQAQSTPPKLSPEQTRRSMRIKIAESYPRLATLYRTIRHRA